MHFALQGGTGAGVGAGGMGEEEVEKELIRRVEVWLRLLQYDLGGSCVRMCPVHRGREGGRGSRGVDLLDFE